MFNTWNRIGQEINPENLSRGIVDVKVMFIKKASYKVLQSLNMFILVGNFWVLGDPNT